MKKKILTIIGARPQFVKAAPFSKAVKENGKFTELLVHTGQHYDFEMSQVFFDEMGIPAPAYNLECGGGTHAVMTAEIMKKLEPLMISEKPDAVLVYGDTNSTIAGALVASKLHIPIVHVEAGLRSFNRRMPEEINRIVADRLSSVLFCPTGTAVKHLKAEGITKNVFHTGDIMYDAAIQSAEAASKRSAILKDLGVKEKQYALITVHRAENTDSPQRLENILKALTDIKKDLDLVFPVHPRTVKCAEVAGLTGLLENLGPVKPVGFLDMVMLEKNASLIITDSGGIQKEAFFHGVPCLTLRTETEWTETVDAGWNVLADTADIENIEKAMAYDYKKREITEYGRGDAAVKMVKCLEELL
ncbi:MAG: non-hydrolyzing UDP-N-acetylglucosamine 2-epimerase [Fibrobacterota bacterium]